MIDPRVFSWRAFRRLSKDPLNKRFITLAVQQWTAGHDDQDLGSSDARNWRDGFEAGWNAAQAFREPETTRPAELQAEMDARSGSPNMLAGAPVTVHFRSEGLPDASDPTPDSDAPD